MQSIRGVSAISGRLSIARATPRKSTNETRRFSLNTSIKRQRVATEIFRKERVHDMVV